MKKIISQQQRPKQVTRKGVRPNWAKGKLVTVTDGVRVERVHEDIARERIWKGWAYCPKSKYKNQ